MGQKRKNKAPEGWQGFLTLCLKVKTPDHLDALLNLFLTHEERELVAARYRIIQAILEKRLTQRQIAETYGVSISQITRGSNALKVIDEELLTFLKDYV
jgi:TrpR family trp operon transcriptional repressor